MLKLKRVYEAKQVGDIYHYCTLRDAVQYIIPNDTLSSSGRWYNHLVGSSDVLSFTRDRRFIVDILRGEKVLVCFKVDGDKLSENHKVLPYNDFYDPYFDDSPDYDPVDLEKEEVVVGKIANFSKYIKEISIIQKRSIGGNVLYVQNMIDDIEGYAESNSIPIKVDVFKELLDDGE